MFLPENDTVCEYGKKTGRDQEGVALLEDVCKIAEEGETPPFFSFDCILLAMTLVSLKGPRVGLRSFPTLETEALCTMPVSHLSEVFALQDSFLSSRLDVSGILHWELGGGDRSISSLNETQ